MEGMMEPPPPGIVPNFPPHYPFKWQQKIMPEPHPNHLLSMGLPSSFSTPRRSNPGYGGYQYCQGYEEAQERSENSNEYYDGYDGEGYENQGSYDHGDGGNHAGQSDEYGAYEDDPEWQGEDRWNEDGIQNNGADYGHSSGRFDPNLAPVFGAPSPAPQTKNHYYNLAPKQAASGNTNNRHDNFENVASQRPKKQEPSEGKKQYLRKVFGDRYCEGCNYGFHSLEKFREHLESHVKCPFAGCGLETTIVRLDEHLTVAHLLNPSASKQIDTAEYLRQRKNHFPSVQRALLKTALAKQQKKRGEVLAIDQNWEKRGNDDEKESNVDQNVEASTSTPAPEADSIHVDSHEYEPVKWTKPPRRNLNRNQDGVSKRKYLEDRRQRVMDKRRKVVYHRKREVFVEREVDVLSRIPAFCGIEAYREPQECALASTVSQRDTSQSEQVAVLDISDEDDDIPAAAHSSSPLKNTASGVTPASSSNTHLCEVTNSVKEVCDQATPLVAGGALGLLLGDYGTDSEDEGSGDTCAPIVNKNSALLNGPSASPVQSTVSDFCCSSQSNTYTGGSSIVVKPEDNNSSNTHSSDVGGGDILPLVTIPENLTAVLRASSESEEESVDVKVPGGGESKRRRRGKRGKKKKKSHVAEAEMDLGDNSAIQNNSDMPCRSQCNEDGGVGNTSLKSTVIVGPAAPHLKPLNKKEVVSEDEWLETAPRKRLPTTLWTENKIFSYQLKGQYKKFKNNYKKSLLVKLLGDEVVRERNIILQCAKFIVQNDFFEQKKLQSLPQTKCALVVEQNDEDIEVSTPLATRADCEGVNENTLCQAEQTNPDDAVNGC